MILSTLQILGLILIVLGVGLWSPALGLAAFGASVFLVANSLED